MTAVDDLIAFVRQQLDEDERIARRAASLCGCHTSGFPNWSYVEGENDGRIVIVDEPHGYHPLVGRLGLCRRWNRSYSDWFHAEHIVRWDPARALAEVKAKRAILDARDAADEDAKRNRNEPGFLAEAAAYDNVIRDLAQPYAGREGWREEWRL